jgi:3'-5' exoribonuclease
MVEQDFLIVRKTLSPFKNAGKGNYLALVLADKTGQIQARMWENADTFHEKATENKVYWIKGRVEKYNNFMQIKVDDLAPLDDAQFDAATYLAASTRPLPEMRAELRAVLEKVGHPGLREFFLEWLLDSDFAASYSYAPAAKQIHHAYVAGLIEHSLEVAKFALSVQELYPEADRDILIIASLLHDIGKVAEYVCGLGIDITDQGRLIGHTVIGYNMLQQRAAGDARVPDDKLTHLGHIMLSHHGELMYGAPVMPATLEAVIVHHADLTSGRVRQFTRALNEFAPEENWLYEKNLGRMIYRGYVGAEPGEAE